VKLTYFITLPVLIILLVAESCHHSGRRFSNRVFLRQLSNMEYKLDNRIIPLEKGVYSGEILPGAASTINVKLSEWLALGDINGDKQSDAVVVLIHNAGGSGTFHYLVPVVKDSDNLCALDAVLLGDRISMVSLNIENQQINIVYLKHGSEEAMSTPPSREIQRHFRLQDHALTEVNDKSLNVAAILSGYSR